MTQTSEFITSRDAREVEVEDIKGNLSAFGIEQSPQNDNLEEMGN